jgi:pimeloyl-ACP methyl ester carboxylesterase
LVDIPQTLKFYLRENFNKYLEYAEEQEKQNKTNELMPKESFIHPISVKTFLRYARDNKEIDFAGYGRDTKLEKLNNIDVPLFMRWGNDNEMILQRAEELVDIVNNTLKNENKDIDYIDGANHGYENREEELAEQIIKFII